MGMSNMLGSSGELSRQYTDDLKIFLETIIETAGVTTRRISARKRRRVPRRHLGSLMIVNTLSAGRIPPEKPKIHNYQS
jgi:hypothetical protein